MRRDTPIKSYEELKGSEGRQIFFRAERFRSRDLFKMGAPSLTLNQVVYELDNVSLSGLAARVPRDHENVLQKQPVTIRLEVEGESLFESQGEVVRSEVTRGGTKLGISFRESSFNVREIVSNYKELMLRKSIATFAEADTQAVPMEYRALCADVLQFLRIYRDGLQDAYTTSEKADWQADVLAACEERFIPQWQDLWRRANAIVEPLMDDPAALQAVKRYTELVLTPDFMPGAIWRRSYEKPLGYPGDFEIMRMVYEWQREGETAYQKLIHRIGLDVAECIATRMVVMREIIAKTVLERSGRDRKAAHITSIGCGPAREVSDYLSIREIPGAVQFTLIDQDHDALAHAYETTYSHVMRLNGKAAVNCLHAAFNQLFDTKELFGKLAKQDLIYTVGLVDYLKPRRAELWISSLFDFLAPGGKLVVSNMRKTEMSNLWPMEFICDWTVLYRTEDEMKQLAAKLPASKVETALDSTGRVVFLIIEK